MAECAADASCVFECDMAARMLNETKLTAAKQTVDKSKAAACSILLWPRTATPRTRSFLLLRRLRNPTLILDE